MRSVLKQRNGATLVEVLVAIFIMAIGLVTLLTLFPLGALIMQQALRDNRTAQSGANAGALGEALNIRFDTTVSAAFTNPGGNNYDGPSNPVYVDPFGSLLGAGPLGPGITRQNVSFVQSYADAFRWFSLLDDMTFNRDDPVAGKPYSATSGPVAGVVQREGRYTWTYLLRRPSWAVPSVVDMTIVVFNGRQLSLPLAEYSYTGITFNTTTNFVTLPYAGQQSPTPPPIRKGSWILDATLTGNNGPDPHGFFYRVVGITDQGTQALLELQTTPRAGTTNGVLMVLEGVTEVFEKGSGWQP
jgi:hypothetical protein